MESNIEQNIFVFIKIVRYSISMTMNMTMKSFSAIFRAFNKDRENAVDHKIIAIEKQLSVITKLHAKDMKEMKALIESVSKASVENLKLDSSIKEEIKEIKEEDKKELAFMIANMEKELKDARDELEKLKPTPKLGSENVDPVLWGQDQNMVNQVQNQEGLPVSLDADVNKIDFPAGVNYQFTGPPGHYPNPYPQIWSSEVVKAWDTPFDTVQGTIPFDGAPGVI
jgi:predicted RND superfamily exporter protein